MAVLPLTPYNPPAIEDQVIPYVTTTQKASTPTFVAVGASGSGSIPVGARGWSFKILTGTGTFGGVTVPTSFSDSNEAGLLTAIPYTTAAASSAYVRYHT